MAATGKLGPYEFGKQLIETLDLDPLYVMIYQAALPRSQLARYMLAYWCFYDTGTASWLTDQRDYWAAMYVAADGSEHPRGGDRRHFRTDNACSCVRDLRRRNQTAEQLLDWLSYNGALTTLAAVMNRIQGLVGFGPTTAFKAADMLERLWGCDIRLGAVGEPLLMSKVPTQGAGSLLDYDLAWTDIGGTDWDVREYAHTRLIEALGHYYTPPTFERPISVLETETILCKWQHHLNGSYEIGKGKEAQRKGLARYLKRSRTAQEMYRAGRVAGLWYPLWKRYAVPSGHLPAGGAAESTVPFSRAR